MQARSPVRSTLELHRNKSLTVFSCDVVRWWWWWWWWGGGGLFGVSERGGVM